MPVPGSAFPLPDIPLLDGGRLTPARLTASLTVLNVYRGLHCPRCRRQMEDFVAAHDAFVAEGVEVISISTDPEARAAEARAHWAIQGMPLGYDLSIGDARAMGCFISQSIREGETDFFAEAALFLLKPDGTLYGAAINSFPFLRPTAEQVLDVASIVRERDYPPRGTVAA